MKIEFRNITYRDNWEFGERWIDGEFITTYCRLLWYYQTPAISGSFIKYSVNIDEVKTLRRKWFKTLTREEKLNQIKRLLKEGYNLYNDEINLLTE